MKTIKIIFLVFTIGSCIHFGADANIFEHIVLLIYMGICTWSTQELSEGLIDEKRRLKAERATKNRTTDITKMMATIPVPNGVKYREIHLI